MRKTWWLIALGVLVSSAGCASVGRTAEENKANLDRIFALEMRELTDDWMLISQTERPSRLNDYYIR